MRRPRGTGRVGQVSLTTGGAFYPNKINFPFLNGHQGENTSFISIVYVNNTESHVNKTSEARIEKKG